jgi:hypothetical protein
MEKRNDPANEGHSREWQDRARVVLDAKKAARTEASPDQSPVGGNANDDAEETRRGDKTDDSNEDDRVY